MACETVILLMSSVAEALSQISDVLCAQDLWLNDNRVEDRDELLSRIEELSGSLTCLYAANNPAMADAANFRKRCLRFLFKLEQLNDQLVTR